MSIRDTYSHARANFAELWDKVEDSREPAILERRGHDDMALLPADELNSLQETAYLMRSPKNATRLLSALLRSRRGQTPPIELDSLIQELELADEFN